MKPPWQAKLFVMAIVTCIAFMLLTAAAMLTFPGGTLQDHNAPHYLFFQNPFSDLGRTHVFNGKTNSLSMSLFMLAMLGGGIGLATFFIGFAATLKHKRVTRVLSLIGAVLGVLAAVCFIGVAFTPWDLYADLHMSFVMTAFRSLLLATLIDLVAVLIEGRFRYALIAPFAMFTVILFFYIILLTAGRYGGKYSDLRLQTTGQKIVVYSAIIMVIVQSVQMRRPPSHLPPAPRDDSHDGTA